MSGTTLDTPVVIKEKTSRAPFFLAGPATLLFIGLVLLPLALTV